MPFKVGDQIECYDPSDPNYARVVLGTIRGFVGDGATVQTEYGKWIYVPLRSLRFRLRPEGANALGASPQASGLTKLI